MSYNRTAPGEQYPYLTTKEHEKDVDYHFRWKAYYSANNCQKYLEFIKQYQNTPPKRYQPKY